MAAALPIFTASLTVSTGLTHLRHLCCRAARSMERHTPAVRVLAPSSPLKRTAPTSPIFTALLATSIAAIRTQDCSYQAAHCMGRRQVLVLPSQISGLSLRSTPTAAASLCSRPLLALKILEIHSEDWSYPATCFMARLS